MKKFLSLLCILFSFYSNAVPITYGVTVSANEADELKRLLKQLSMNLDDEDQILIQVDKDNYTQDVVDVINYFAKKVPSEQFRVIYFPLNKDFGSFKTNLLKNAGDKGFMFQLDADEYLNPSLMINFKYYVAKNQDADLIMMPRANYYINMEENKDFQEMYKNDSDQLSRFRYPDLQGKLINLSNKTLKYEGKLHEGLIGAKKFVTMPHDKLDPTWDLIHLKTMKKQKVADQLYRDMGQK